jgi:hypothetical protein
MWNRTMMVAVVAAVSLWGARGARANEMARLDLELMAREVFTLLQYAELGVWMEHQLKEADPKACRTKLAGFKKRGVKDDDRIAHPGFKTHPKAEAHQGSHRIRAADAGWLCDRLAEAHEKQAYLSAVAAAMQLEHWMTMVKADDAGSVKDQLVPKAEACVKAIDAALAAGVPGTTTVRHPNGSQVTFTDARPRCVKLVDAAREFEAKVTAREEEKRRKALAKYQAVGIKGKRLELFAHYDHIEWYYAGCKSSTDDPNKLKAAKALFQWLTDSNGVITIRKYTFAGDNYKVSEKTYTSERAAYSGCK